MSKFVVLFLAVLACFCEVRAGLKPGDCEVCVSFLSKFAKSLSDNDIDMKPANIELELMKACKAAKGKDERFCYYIGATDISATKLVNTVTRPLSFNKPAEKICESLKKQDAQICEIKYEKQIDLETVDLKTLRVKELKKILNNWGEDCRGCVEKSEFINKINTLKVHHMEL